MYTFEINLDAHVVVLRLGGREPELGVRCNRREREGDKERGRESSMEQGDLLFIGRTAVVIAKSRQGERGREIGDRLRDSISENTLYTNALQYTIVYGNIICRARVPLTEHYFPLRSSLSHYYYYATHFLCLPVFSGLTVQSGTTAHDYPGPF
eukprot:sb/3473331/